MNRIDLDASSWVLQGNLPNSIGFDFNELWNLHPNEYNKVQIMGRIVDTPRWQQSYMRPYAYSGLVHNALPLPQQFQPFLDWANQLEGLPTFNQALINWYQNGHHYIGPHSDDTRQLVTDSPILSISLGQSRTFRIRDKTTKSIVRDIEMTHGSYIVMCGKMQEKYTHEVTKVLGKKGENLGKRINVTFRVFK